MICPNCKQRWALFDPRDFGFDPNVGFKPLHAYATHIRDVCYQANNEALCPDCEKDWSEEALVS